MKNFRFNDLKTLAGRLVSGIILVMMFISMNAFSQNLVPDSVEFKALKDLYTSTSGSSWTTKTNWPTTWPAASTVTSSQFGTWYGVTVINGDVSSLLLQSNNLSGSLPSALGNLTSLDQIDLSANQLTGSIPSTIPNLTKLTNLKLSNNQITGSVPSNIGALNKLVFLNLSHNQITGGIPSSLGNMTELTSLYFSYNASLGGTIPPSIGHCSKLSVLDLRGNSLTGSVPDALSDLIHLTQLYLGGNYLSGQIPASIFNIPTLQFAFLDTNAFTGSIPSTVGNCTTLIYLDVSSNQLTGSVPSSIGGLTALAGLYLNSNKLSGDLPASFADMYGMQSINLSSNQFTGTLPDISGMSNLYTFYAGHNNFMGTLNASYASSAMNHVAGFDVGNNQLSGTFPSMMQWTSLQYLTIGNNHFTGAFPSVANCPSLRYIESTNNAFSTAPSSLFNLANAYYISFEYNEVKDIPNLLSDYNANALHPYQYGAYYFDGNRLDYSQMEVIKALQISYCTFAPQKSINDIQRVTISGSTLTIPSRPGGQHSTVSWEKLQNNTWTSLGNSSPTFSKSPADVNDEGQYRWTTTNSYVTGVTLQSAPITVKVAGRVTLDNWGFQYRYDGRKRMIQKKVPGADWVYMVYDERDRLVLTQDGNQRLNKQWSYTRYDTLNRPVVTGIYTHTSFIDQQTMSGLVSTSKFCERFVGGAANDGYTKAVLSATNFPGQFEALTVTYYDNYDFVSDFTTAVYTYDAAHLDSLPALASTTVLDHVTGTKVKGLSGNSSLKTVTYYDDKYRVIQVVADNNVAGTDRASNLLDFTGKVRRSLTTQSRAPIKWNAEYASFTANSVHGMISGLGAGASSVQKLAANTDGWIEFSSSDIKDTKSIGLSSTPTHSIWGVKYAIFMSQGSSAVYESGNPLGFSYFGPNDVFRIERTGTTIKYYKNGTLWYTSMIPSSSELAIDIGLDGLASSLENVRASFTTSTSISELRTFDYDHAGRLLRTWHSIDNAPLVLLSKNEYNELGQLIDKKLHSTEMRGTSEGTRHYKQSTDYRYNIRGWLTSINNSQLTVDGGATNDETGDLFGMELGYNNSLITGSTGLFNGNISAMKWSSNFALGSIKDVGYKYSYDPMNRITGAAYNTHSTSGWISKNSFSESGYKYDLNGNIKSLTRRDSAGLKMDTLTYDYGAARSNQLLGVSDAGDVENGFSDGNIGSDDYAYDANGNMTVDRNKYIYSITYNHLNLPERVIKNDGQTIRYFYDATGRKLSQQVFSAQYASKKRTDYAGDFYYENDMLKFINTGEGRVIPDLTNGQYEVVASYGLDGNVVDRSGNGLTGTIYGGATTTTDHNGSAGSAISMDGYDDYIGIPDNSVFDFGDRSFSLSFWAKKLAASSGWNNEMGVNKWNTGGSPGTNSWAMSLATGANSDIPSFAIESGTTIYSASATTSMAVNQWYLLRVVRSGGKMQIFVNNNLEGETTLPVTAAVNRTSLPVYIGKIDIGYNTNAVYDELVISHDLSHKNRGNEYQYHMKDHLGNVRMTFTTKNETDAATGTLENVNATIEQGKFLRFAEARRVYSEIFDKTNGSSPGYSQRLNGSQDEKFGLARSLSVMPGDTIRAEVYGKYVEANTGSNWTGAFTTLMGQISSATANVVIDGSNFASSTSFFPFNPAFGDGRGPGGPKAYLNWLIFDRDFKKLIQGYKRMTSAPAEHGQNVAHERMYSPDILITEPGYVYIYLSNEEPNGAPVEVYFDDFKVTHVKSPVIETSDYYALGLVSQNYVRENSVRNQYKYLGKERIDDLTLGVYSYGARTYDPSDGRWWSADPLADKYFSVSPYAYVFNNPINAIDPDGMRVFFVGGAGNDQIGWNYTAKWQRAFDQGGIQGFTTISASHDNPQSVRDGNTPFGDVMFTVNHRSNSYETAMMGPNVGGGYSQPEIREVQDEQIDNAAGQIRQSLSSKPLVTGEQVNLVGYSYGSVLQAHVALRLANSGQKIDNLVLVGSSISDKSELYQQLLKNKNIGKVHRIDIENDLLSNPQDMSDFLRGGLVQNRDPNNVGQGPHFDLARPGNGQGDNNDTYKHIQSVVVEWLKQQGVK